MPEKLFEFERETSGPGGRRVRWRISVGAALVWAVVAVVLALTGHGLSGIPDLVLRYFAKP